MKEGRGEEKEGRGGEKEGREEEKEGRGEEKEGIVKGKETRGSQGKWQTHVRKVLHLTLLLQNIF